MDSTPQMRFPVADMEVEIVLTISLLVWRGGW